MKLKHLKSLGSGGFGNVDLVEDSSGQLFARKTFSVNQPLAASLVDNVKKRFAREAKVQSGITHNNIVPIIGGDLDADPPFFLMPAAEASLADDIEKDRTLNGHWRSAFMDIIAALEELHSLGMCHRDLKPQNVLRFSDNSTSETRDIYAISDFGFISLNDSRFSALTNTGMKRGSDFYTAPEIVSDLRNASPQSDIFSLGCILHDMVGHEDRIPCNEIREDGPYAGIFLGCTRKNQKYRFKSVRALAEALLSIEDETVTVSSPRAETLAEALDGPEPLTESLSSALVEFLDVNQGSQDSSVLLRKLTAERIEELCATFADDAAKIGSIFARWIHDSSFDFDFCDTLAARLNVLVTRCPLGVKAECLLAMLELGTSHNRWYVERMFVALCGPDMDPALAKRLSVEMRVSGDRVCRSIDHLESSISAKRDRLHPILVKTLGEMCK